MPIRVLHLVAGNLYGGVESMLLTLAKYRASCPAMEPEFAVCFEGRLSRELEATGARVNSIGAMRARNPASVWACRARLRHLIEVQQPDAVIFHSLWPYVLLGLDRRMEDVLRVVWMHGPVDKAGLLELAARSRRPNLVVANSNFTARSAEKVFGKTKVKVVYCPTSLERTESGADVRRLVRSEFQTTAEDVVIIQVSRLERWKGQQVHLRALGNLRSQENWTAWIVGGAQRPSEQAYLEELKTLTVKLGISGRVRFLGERKDVARLLAAADIHCQPNVGAEPFGLTFVEAMASGLPVITSRLGGAVELLDDNCGILCAPGDESEVATALTRLIGDPALRAMLGRNGSQRARDLCEPQQRLHELCEALHDCCTTLRSRTVA
jgi:glycosyltransferase involved in cell wall biosynthesis